jgi:hypothetical protein
MEESVQKVLSSMKASDFHIDDAGRVVVSNPTLSRALANAIGSGSVLRAEDNGNCNCLAQESVAKIASELVDRALDNINCNCLPMAQ